MKLTLILVGKTDGKLYAEAIDDYAKRISHYTPFNIKVIPDLKNSKSLSEKQQKEKEGELILKSIEDKSLVVLLDERGKEMRSIELAAWLENKQLTGVAHDVLPPDGETCVHGTNLPCMHHHQERALPPRVSKEARSKQARDKGIHLVCSLLVCLPTK